MEKVIVVMQYDQELLDEEGQSFSGEMGWVEESGIYMIDELGTYEDHVKSKINLLTELHKALRFVEDTLSSLPDGEIIQEDYQRVQDRLTELEVEINQLNQEL